MYNIQTSKQKQLQASGLKKKMMKVFGSVDSLTLETQCINLTLSKKGNPFTLNVTKPEKQINLKCTELRWHLYCKCWPDGDVIIKHHFHLSISDENRQCYTEDKKPRFSYRTCFSAQQANPARWIPSEQDWKLQLKALIMCTSTPQVLSSDTTLSWRLSNVLLLKDIQGWNDSYLLHSRSKSPRELIKILPLCKEGKRIIFIHQTE